MENGDPGAMTRNQATELVVCSALSSLLGATAPWATRTSAWPDDGRHDHRYRRSGLDWRGICWARWGDGARCSEGLAICVHRQRALFFDGL